MNKKIYLKPEVEARLLQYESPLATSGGEKSPIPCVQFGGDELDDDTADDKEPVY